MMLRQARVRTTSRSTWNAQAIPSAWKSTRARWSKKSRPSWRKTCTGRAWPARRLEAPAADARALGRDRVRFALELVRQGVEFGRLASCCVRERLREQPVREPGIPRQERSVQIRADRTSEPAAFESALAV